MTKYFYVDKSYDSLVKIAGEKDITVVKDSYLSINYKWLIKEPGKFYYNEQEYDVKEGDLVILTYAPTPEDGPQIIILSAMELLNIINKRDEYRKKIESEKCESCCCGCDSCRPCN